MRLQSDMVERTLDQFGAEALPDDHPAIPKLSEVFGDHTFFVDDDGLHIIEPAATGMPGDVVGNVMRVGRGEDAAQTTLALHEPEPSDLMIDLGSDEPYPAA
jgi:hypothetical protein